MGEVRAISGHFHCLTTRRIAGSAFADQFELVVYPGSVVAASSMLRNPLLVRRRYLEQTSPLDLLRACPLGGQVRLVFPRCTAGSFCACLSDHLQALIPGHVPSPSGRGLG